LASFEPQTSRIKDMGLMTETPWEAAVYAASMAPSNTASNVDYHRENLRQLKKMQAEVRLKKRGRSEPTSQSFSADRGQ